MKRLIAGLLSLGLMGAALGASAAGTIDVSSIRLEFIGTDDVGEGAGVGFSHRYTDIMPGSGNTVDARVTILDIVNLESNPNSNASAPTPDLKVKKIDDRTSNIDRNKNIELEIDVFDTPAASDTGYVTFRVEFLESGTLVPVVLSNLSLYVTDIDDQQFMQVSGITSYRLTSTTKLTVKQNSDDSSIPVGSIRFVAPNVSSSSTDPDASDFWAEISVNEASYLDFTFGQDELGDASFNLVFTKTDWTGLTAVDVTPPAPTYTVSYDGNGSTAGTAPASQSGSSFITVSGNTGSLTKPGFDFTGWNSAADGTGLVVKAAEQFRPTSNIMLYAQWSPAAATTTTVAPTTTVAEGEVDQADDDEVREESLPSTGFSRTLLLFAAVLAVLVGFRLRRSAVDRV